MKIFGTWIERVKKKEKVFRSLSSPSKEGWVGRGIKMIVFWEGFFSKSVQMLLKLNPANVCEWESITDLSCVFSHSKLHACFREKSFKTDLCCGCVAVSAHTVDLWKGEVNGGILIHCLLIPPLYSGEVAPERFSAIRVCDHKVLATCIHLHGGDLCLSFRKTNVMWSLPQ